MLEFVILVDKDDNEIGTCEKIDAHKKGLLHRAFSILIFNSAGQMLIQKRAQNKYHCPGLWSNACCSHPRPGENLLSAAIRRLNEELGIVCDLRHSDSFIYRTEFSNGLVEYELDHVFIGQSDSTPVLNKNEVEEFKWIYLEDLKTDVLDHPEKYTSWFKAILNRPQFPQSIFLPEAKY